MKKLRRGRVLFTLFLVLSMLLVPQGISFAQEERLNGQEAPVKEIVPADSPEEVDAPVEDGTPVLAPQDPAEELVGDLGLAEEGTDAAVTVDESATEPELATEPEATEEAQPTAEPERDIEQEEATEPVTTAETEGIVEAKEIAQPEAGIEKEEAGQEEAIPNAEDTTTAELKQTKDALQDREPRVQTMSIGQAANGDEMVISIIHTNDVHGRVEDDPENGVVGYARLKALIDKRKALGPVIVLDAGDATHGTNFANLEGGKSVIELMNIVGVDAMTLGNHDFNYGISGIKKMQELANFKIMASNLVEDATGVRPFNEDLLLDVFGVKVGIFGLATPETKIKSNPKNTEGYSFLDTYQVAEEKIASLRERGANYIILLSHLGMDEPSPENGNINTYKLLDRVRGIDLVVDGHSHTVLKEGNLYQNTLIASTGSMMNNIGEVELVFDAATKQFTDAQAGLLDYGFMAEAMDQDQKVQDYIDAVNAEQAPLLEVVGNTADLLDGKRENVRTGETNLADLITDAMLDKSGADLVITNGGGIRASIGEGDITYGEVYEVLPFGNEIAVIEVTGREILDALLHGTKVYPKTNGSFPQVAGMSYIIIDDDKDPETPVVITDVMINGEKLNLSKTYRLATNDFMAEGGDGYDMFKGKKIISTHGTMLDATVERIKDLSKDGAFSYSIDGRIKAMSTAEYEAMKAAEDKKEKDGVKVASNGNISIGKGSDNPKTGDPISDSFVLLLVATGALLAVTLKKEEFIGE